MTKAFDRVRALYGMAHAYDAQWELREDQEAEFNAAIAQRDVERDHRLGGQARTRLEALQGRLISDLNEAELALADAQRNGEQERVRGLEYLISYLSSYKRDAINADKLMEKRP